MWSFLYSYSIWKLLLVGDYIATKLLVLTTRTVYGIAASASLTVAPAIFFFSRPGSTAAHRLMQRIRLCHPKWPTMTEDVNSYRPVIPGTSIYLKKRFLACSYIESGWAGLGRPRSISCYLFPPTTDDKPSPKGLCPPPPPSRSTPKRRMEKKRRGPELRSSTYWRIDSSGWTWWSRNRTDTQKNRNKKLFLLLSYVARTDSL
jgi:hypothetical protein